MAVTFNLSDIGNGTTLSENNLKITTTSHSGGSRANKSVLKGNVNYYFEVEIQKISSNIDIGISDISYEYKEDITLYEKVCVTRESSVGVVGVLLNISMGYANFYKNGIFKETKIIPAELLNQQMFPIVRTSTSTGARQALGNFGASSFKYVPNKLLKNTKSYDESIVLKSLSSLLVKNPSTNQHYSLAEKTLIPLPDASPETIITHGIQAGKEIQLDEAFDKIRRITENDDGTQSIIDEVVEPFSVYDYISENPQAVIYTELTDDITVSTTTEPYTLYDEFGDEVEVLYYTDDEEATASDLVIEANWSPLDELEGDFEIVTWTDESAETAQRQIEIKDLYPSEYVPMTNWINVKDLVGISIKNVTDVFAPFLIEKKNDPNRYAYHQGYFYPTTEDAHSIHNYGLTPSIINALTKEEWEEFLEGEEEIKFHFLFSNRSIGTVSKSASLDVIHQIGQIQVLRSIVKSTPTATKLELEASVYSMAGRLESIERINLNNLLELELRTSILMKMPLIQSKEMIIETFDDNEYEVHQTIEQQVEVPSTEVDEEGNPLPSTWETITVAKPSDYNAAQSAFLNEFKVSVPINVSDAAEKLVMQIAGNGVELILTDGMISKTLFDLYNEEIDISAMNKETLVVQANGQAGSTLKGIAYAWT